MVFAFAGDSTTTRLRANPTSLAFGCHSEGTDGVVSPTHPPLCQGSDSVPVFPDLVIRLSTPPTPGALPSGRLGLRSEADAGLRRARGRCRQLFLRLAAGGDGGAGVRGAPQRPAEAG